jgi:hypothetical protein
MAPASLPNSTGSARIGVGDFDLAAATTGLEEGRSRLLPAGEIATPEHRI